jgi:hypothetical protein
MTFFPRPPRAVAWGLLAFLLPPAAPARAADYLRFLPADTKVVVTVNVTALPEKDQKAWQQLGEQLYGAHLTPELKGKGNKLAVRDVTTLTFAMPYAGWPGGMVIVRGKVDAKLLAEQARACAKLSGGAVAELKPTRGQPVPVFRRVVSDKGPLLPLPQRLALALDNLVAGWEVYFAAVDEETVILTVNPAKGVLSFLQPPGHTAIVHAVKAAPKTTRPRAPAGLLELLGKLDGRAWLSGVVMDDALDPRLALLLPEQNATFQRWEHVVGSVREGKEVEATLVATGKDVDEAKELEKNARENAKLFAAVWPTLSGDPGQKAVLKELAESFRVSRQDAVVTVTWKIEGAKTRRLFAPVPRKKN